MMMKPEDLLTAYLDICRKALKANRNRFPFGQILAAMTDHASLNPSKIEVIDDMAADGASNVIFFKSKSSGFAVCQRLCPGCSGQCADETGEQSWQVKTSYMDDVIRNSETYIKNPAMLDWEWVSIKR